MFKYIALALVIATASVEAKGEPSCNDIRKMVFEKCDANDDKKITWKEAKKCGAPRKFKPEFMDVAGKDRAVDGKEFMGKCKEMMGKGKGKKE